jgi:GTP-binding protein Era
MAAKRPRKSKRIPFHSGFVSVLGRPNAGKSTLINAIAGEKLSIVSAKPQTTRSTLQAVVNRENAQIVFVDTPGIHDPKGLLHTRMMEEARGAMRDQDVLIWMADATEPFAKSSAGLQLLEGNETPAILVLNKIDRVPAKHDLLPLLEEYGKAHTFVDLIPASATRGEGLKELEQAILTRLPEGPQYFPPGQLTDAPERFLAAELVREKILELTGQEVPHSVAIAVESWEESPRLLKIAAVIHVERQGQKRIIVGAGASMLKQIGSAARTELEERYEKKVFLELFVKVKPAWRESASFLAELDWRV